MNREARRRQDRAHRTAQALAAAAPTMPGCPDCSAHVEPEEVSPGVLALNVMHDDSCPAWQVMQQGPR